MEDSPTLELMKEYGIQPTRENFLKASHPFDKNPPKQLDAEEEAELPAQFQTAHRDMDARLFKKVQKDKEKAAKEKANKKA
jgi:hypothetical protein